MLKIGLLCNTAAAFPLLQWLQGQNLLAGVAVLDRPSPFLDDVSVLAGRVQVKLTKIDGSKVTNALIDWQTNVGAELVLVLGFPRKVPTSVLSAISLGYYNIHFGKLPIYAGSAPVFWQVVHREKQGVLTIHQMDEGFDTGPVAVEMPFEMGPGQTFGLVEANYGFVAIHAVLQLLNGIVNKSMVLQPQGSVTPIPLPKPSVKDLVIPWERADANAINALVLATNPWNRGAIAVIKGLDVKIIDVTPGPHATLPPGTIFRTPEGEMAVACHNQTSVILLILLCSFGYFEKQRIWTFGLIEGDRFELINL